MPNLDNYIWIVAAGIVLVMTFIGYIAEKTDFGRQKIEKRENKEIKKEKKAKEVKQSKLKLNEAVYNNDKIPTKETVDEQIISEVDPFAEIVPTVKDELNDTPVLSDNFQNNNVSVPEEDLTVPLEDTTVKDEQEDEIIDEDIWKF